MVEHFTTKEQDTELSKAQDTMVSKTDEIFDETLKNSFSKLLKEPNPRVIENILNFSKSLIK